MSQAIVQPNQDTYENTTGQVLDFATAVDVYENEEELLLYADTPGTTAEQVSVDLEGNQLRILAHATGTDGTKIEYRRAFRIGVHVDSKGITATLKNGVLTVKLPKAEASRPRKIEVRAA